MRLTIESRRVDLHLATSKWYSIEREAVFPRAFRVRLGRYVWDWVNGWRKALP